MNNIIGININNKYGRKIGFIKLIAIQIYIFFGGYADFQDICWKKIRRLVFICQGNICRSAYADAYSRYCGLRTASAGLAADQDGNADSQVIRMAAQRNIDLISHRTTHIDNFKREDGDLFLCMEPSQAVFMRRLIGNNAKQQITLLGLWAKDDKRPFLQDPYGLKDEYLQTCLDVIDSAINQVQFLLHSDTEIINACKKE